MVLLVLTLLVVQIVVSTHLTRIRGLPSGYPSPVVDANVPSLGVNAALEQYNDEDKDKELGAFHVPSVYVGQNMRLLRDCTPPLASRQGKRVA